MTSLFQYKADAAIVPQWPPTLEDFVDQQNWGLKSRKSPHSYDVHEILNPSPNSEIFGLGQGDWCKTQSDNHDMVYDKRDQILFNQQKFIKLEIWATF